jgi:hypothetical protein
MPLTANHADDIQFDEWTYSILLTLNRFAIDLALTIVAVYVSFDYALADSKAATLVCCVLRIVCAVCAPV